MNLIKWVGVPVAVLALVATIAGVSAGVAGLTLTGVITGLFCSAAMLAAVSDGAPPQRMAGTAHPHFAPAGGRVKSTR